MPAISQYEFSALLAIEQGAREAFLAAAVRPEADVEQFAKTTHEAAVAECSAEHPEALAMMADGYLTALADSDGLKRAFDRGAAIFGNADLAGRITVLHKATGLTTDYGR